VISHSSSFSFLDDEMSRKFPSLQPPDFDSLWTLSNVNRDTFLDKEEYVIFCHLHAKFLETGIIPLYLPEVLVPPVISFPNGDKYIGVFDRNGLYTGQGTYKFMNGSYYEGNFLHGQFHGFGKFYESSAKDLYEGEFKGDLFHGLGKLSYGNKDVYEGLFVEGKPEGQGKYAYTSGSYYQGGFLNGVFHGLGTFRDSSGELLEGEFKVTTTK
jgi:hypothetical protein